jgi:hypothetical protein
MMSDKDLVFRGDVLARKCKYYVYDETGCCCEEFAVPVEDINRISAATQEMSAVEYEKALWRMYENRPFCSELKQHMEIFDTRFDDPLAIEKAVAIIEKWAREHPERSEE